MKNEKICDMYPVEKSTPLMIRIYRTEKIIMVTPTMFDKIQQVAAEIHVKTEFTVVSGHLDEVGRDSVLKGGRIYISTK